jgi:hypothetical protein
VQDPADALVPGMPSSAIAATTPDAVVPIADLPGVLARLARASVPGAEEETPMSAEPDPAEMQHGPNRPDGPASGFTCPECRSEVSKPASRKTVALLLAAGVEPVDQEEAEAPVLPSADRSPDPGAPAFTLDDVIGFHFQLGDDAAIAYGLGIL